MSHRNKFATNRVPAKAEIYVATEPDYDDWHRLGKEHVTMQRRDGRAVHMRRATRPKPRHQALNAILKLDPNPGRTHRVLI